MHVLNPLGFVNFPVYSACYNIFVLFLMLFLLLFLYFMLACISEKTEEILLKYEKC